MRPSSISLVDAAQTIMKSSSHLLICDTCALLDIVRLPAREDNPLQLMRTLQAVSSIESKVATGQIILVCPEPIPMEWDNNINQQKSEALNCLQAMVNNYNLLSVFAQTQGYSLAAFPIKACDVTIFLHDLSERLLDASIILRRDTAVSLRATERAILSTPPARKGAVKDCIIYEHMLELFTLLPTNATATKRVLLTSNVNDFCDSSKTAPKPPIDVELAKHNAVLRTTWISTNAEF